MDLPAEFHRLRRRLDQLGYRQPLPLESLPLVERLFADLLTTTESLRTTMQTPRGTLASGAGGANAQAELYKQDNAKLIKVENGVRKSAKT